MIRWRRIWLDPSYGKLGPRFIRKLAAEIRKGNVEQGCALLAMPPPGAASNYAATRLSSTLRACSVYKGVGRKAGANRVLRGSSWNNNAQNARSAYRNANHPGNRNNNNGFRCARAHDRIEGSAPEQTGIRTILVFDGETKRSPACQ